MPFHQLDDDVKIYYETFGEGAGDWITLLAGYARPIADFKGMGRFLAGKGWRVVAVDARGAGKAECPPAFALEDIAGDVIALWDQLKIARSHLFGLDYGGAVAVTLAAMAPERPVGLVLVATPVSSAHVAVELAGPGRTAKQFQHMVMRYFSPGYLAKNAPVVQGYVRQMARLFMEPDTALGAACQRASLENFDLALRLPQVRAKTLVIHGEHDLVVPPEASTILAAGIPGATHEPWPDTGHLVLAEAPMKLYERVDAFCRSVT